MQEIIQTFLNGISGPLQDLLVAVSVLLVGQLTFVVKEQWRLVKLKASTEQNKILDFIVFNAVQTVGQLYESYDNSNKKILAVAIAQARLKDFGITIDLNVIENAIEAAVFSGANIPGVIVEETSKG